MHPISLPAAESDERPEPPHSDAIESIERLYLPYPNSVERYMRPILRVSDAIEDNERLGLPDSGEPIGINDPGALLQRASIEESQCQSEADKPRDVLRAETGYASYADYLETYYARHPYVEEVQRCLTTSGYYTSNKFTILDVLNDHNSRPRVVLHYYSTSAPRIVTTLRQPPPNVAVQILLWNADGYLSRDVVNALGLGLKIDPRFFGALCRGSRRHLDPKNVTIGGAVATVVRQYKPDQLDTVPIVLIARMEWASYLANVVEEEIGDVLPFQYPAAETCPFYTPPSYLRAFREEYASGKYEHPNYARLLNWCLENEEEPAVDVTDLVLEPLIPLLYL